MATPVCQQLAQKWCNDCHAVGGSLPLRAQLCFDRGNVFQYWRTKLEEACVGCFASQISGWNDSDGEPLALVFAQEHGAGLEAWQTRTRRRDSDSVNTGLNPQPGILLKSLRICSFLARRNSLETSAR
jgi:hypothetical protein